MEETTALSVYNDEQQDEFPVLKAFQQYIDAEQAKARQRMLSLSIFFGVLLTIVVIVFVILLTGASQRNQMLNDRLFDFAMKDRQQASSVVVHQPPTQAMDNSALLAITARLDEIQKNLDKARQEAEEKEKLREENMKAAQEAQEKVRTQESLEIERLKALLQQEREKAVKEREEKREAELEAYRRQHYPEYYEKKASQETKEVPAAQEEETETESDPIQELLDDLEAKDGDKAIKYFDDDDDDEDDDGDEDDEEEKEINPTAARNSWQIPM